MKPYIEIRFERRSGWLSGGLGFFTAIVAFVVLLEIIPDRLSAVLIAATFGIIIALLLPERIGSRW
ncbi:MAG TPA: hypothetical protein VL572_07065 [Pyrinomonadaceae bacterium]|nr:hypothetical protein [Pyrinomonadaceae bacterium]